MKRLLAVFTFVFVWIMFVSISYAIEFQPVTTFSDWNGELFLGSTENIFNPALITPNGSSVDINVTGDTENVWTGIYNNNSAGTIGTFATITISNINGTASVGISDSIGKVGNDKIQAYLSLEQADGKKSIRYKIRAKDMTTGAKKQLTAGVIGEYDGEWNIGDSIDVGFMRTGNDFWFYAEGFPGYVKWSHTGTVEDYSWGAEIWAYANSETKNSITANVTNVYIIKSD
jgi:hypothetical protein